MNNIHKTWSSTSATASPRWLPCCLSSVLLDLVFSSPSSSSTGSCLTIQESRRWISCLGESRTWDKLSFCWLTTSPPSWTREETPKYWIVVSVSSAQVTRSPPTATKRLSLTSSSSSRGLTLTRSNSFLACLVCQQSFQRQCTTSFFCSHANARTCIRASRSHSGTRSRSNIRRPG